MLILVKRKIKVLQNGQSVSF